jgi:hypothetical protein
MIIHFSDLIFYGKIGESSESSMGKLLALCTSSRIKQSTSSNCLPALIAAEDMLTSSQLLLTINISEKIVVLRLGSVFSENQARFQPNPKK